MAVKTGVVYYNVQCFFVKPPLHVAGMGGGALIDDDICCVCRLSPVSSHCLRGASRHCNARALIYQ